MENGHYRWCQDTGERREHDILSGIIIPAQPGPATVHSRLSNQQIIQYKTQYNHNIRHKYNMFPIKAVTVGVLKLT